MRSLTGSMLTTISDVVSGFLLQPVLMKIEAARMHARTIVPLFICTSSKSLKLYQL